MYCSLYFNDFFDHILKRFGKCIHQLQEVGSYLGKVDPFDSETNGNKATDIAHFTFTPIAVPIVRAIYLVQTKIQQLYPRVQTRE